MELRLFLSEFFDAICVTDCGKKDMVQCTHTQLWSVAIAVAHSRPRDPSPQIQLPPPAQLLLQLAQRKIWAVNSAASPSPPPASPAQDSGQQIWLPAQPALLRPQSQPAKISGRILTQQPVRPVSSAKQSQPA
ncbi:hypothetical protein TIFTF001_053789 [Ficus carica]|uniref:Uncharacterized protein n=1 Tax=Ficus carica TaxID=3494 RepID=A0AA88EFQ5_FICCA|nr:hypothetical protein TIFTF001_053789 [Ficus carica]